MARKPWSEMTKNEKLVFLRGETKTLKAKLLVQDDLVKKLGATIAKLQQEVLKVRV